MLEKPTRFPLRSSTRVMSPRVMMWNRRMSSVVARMIRCGARASVVIRTIVGLPPPILMSLRPVWTNSFGTTTPALCRISSAARGEMNCDTFSPFRS